jgi:hypothetical protein
MGYGRLTGIVGSAAICDSPFHNALCSRFN